MTLLPVITVALVSALNILSITTTAKPSDPGLPLSAGRGDQQDLAINPYLDVQKRVLSLLSEDRPWNKDDVEFDGIILRSPEGHSAFDDLREDASKNINQQYRKLHRARAGEGHRIRWRSSSAVMTYPPSRFNPTATVFGPRRNGAFPLQPAKQQAASVFWPALPPSTAATSYSMLAIDGDNKRRQNAFSAAADDSLLGNAHADAVDIPATSDDGSPACPCSSSSSPDDKDAVFDVVERDALLIDGGSVVQQQQQQDRQPSPSSADGRYATSSSPYSSPARHGASRRDDGPSSVSMGKRSSAAARPLDRHARTYRGCGRNLILILENTCNAYHNFDAEKRSLGGRVYDPPLQFPLSRTTAKVTKNGEILLEKRQHHVADEDAGEDTSLVEACCYNSCSRATLLNYCHHLYK